MVKLHFKDKICHRQVSLKFMNNSKSTLTMNLNLKLKFQSTNHFALPLTSHMKIGASAESPSSNGCLFHLAAQEAQQFFYEERALLYQLNRL